MRKCLEICRNYPRKSLPLTDLLWVFIASIALLVPIDTFRIDEILTGAKTGGDPSTIQLWVTIHLERENEKIFDFLVKLTE